MSRAAAGTFQLVPRRRFAGASFGENRSARRGEGDEVIGSRPYRPGDHIAAIDWNASARLSAARGSDEFVVREYLAEEAPTSVIVLDRGPSMSLYGDGLPWLRKPAALAAISDLIATSTLAGRGDVGYLDVSGRDRPFWLAPGGAARRPEIARRHEAAGYDASPTSLALALHTLQRHRRSLPSGSFVFVCSDFLAEPPRPADWLRLRAFQWDVVPVIVQDPVWEQSFPDVGGVLVPYVDPVSGKPADVRLRRREVRARAARNHARHEALVRGFRNAGFDPLVVGTSDRAEALDVFRGWSARRRARLRRAA
ncbi:MAG: DUF58 domain-containing protein [Actinobacteria bacterium]|nr:DUF58 domain-containing protein [Actinomycetota bacterium]